MVLAAPFVPFLLLWLIIYPFLSIHVKEQCFALQKMLNDPNLYLVGGKWLKGVKDKYLRELEV
jgi:hypothetical protein